MRAIAASNRLCLWISADCNPAKNGFLGQFQVPAAHKRGVPLRRRSILRSKPSSVASVDDLNRVDPPCEIIARMKLSIMGQTGQVAGLRLKARFVSVLK